jgi:YHS domain-containing protein
MKNTLIIATFSLLTMTFSSFAQEAKPKQKDKKVAEKETKLEDPVCHMKVKKGGKITTKHKDVEYGFCSESCKESFVKNPEKYIKK